MARTKTYTQFLYSLKAKLATSDVQTEDASFIYGALSERLEEARESARWPDSTVCDERTPVGNLIAWAQTDEKEIGKVWGIYDKDPHGTEIATEYIFDETEAGIKLRDSVTGNVWVEYTPTMEPITDDNVEDIAIPRSLFDYCVWGCVADYKYASGDDEGGAVADQRALQKLIMQKFSLSSNQKQTSRVSVRNSITENHELDAN